MSDNSASPEGASEVPSASAPAPSTRVSTSTVSNKRLIPGLIMAALGCGLSLLTFALEGKPWWPKALGSGVGLAGCWLLASNVGLSLRLIVTIVASAFAVLSFGLGWSWLGWWMGGCAGGFLCAWGYGKGHRGWWFSGALLSAAYLGSCAASLVRVSSTGGVWWPFTQGILTLLLGILFTLYGKNNAGRKRALIGRAGRILILLAAALPYAALLILGLR